MEWIHLSIIEEENINVSELPNGVKNKMKAFKAHLGKHTKSPSESTLRTVKNLSTSIADEIQTWLERDLDNDDLPAETVVEPVDNKSDSDQDQVVVPEKKKTDQVTPEPTQPDTTDPAPTKPPIIIVDNDEIKTKEQLIINIINRDGYIRVAKLSNIINSSATDTIITFGSLSLKKSTSIMATVYRFNK